MQFNFCMFTLGALWTWFQWMRLTLSPFIYYYRNCIKSGMKKSKPEIHIQGERERWKLNDSCKFAKLFLQLKNGRQFYFLWKISDIIFITTQCFTNFSVIQKLPSCFSLLTRKHLVCVVFHLFDIKECKVHIFGIALCVAIENWT